MIPSLEPASILAGLRIFIVISRAELTLLRDVLSELKQMSLDMLDLFNGNLALREIKEMPDE